MYFRAGILLLYLTFYSGKFVEGAPTSCDEDQLKKCADDAEPLLKDSELVVPDSQRTVNQVCSLWTELTNCIGNYTRKCMSRQQRMEFDKTFKDPVLSMSSLCQNPDHRKEYLNHAPCVKKISTEGNYCGNQYRFLIDLVSGSTSTIKQICCARAKFKNCILAQTPSTCDTTEGRNNGRKNNKATTMAVSILDKSLAFISQRCTSSSFQEADCPGIDSKLTRVNSKGPLGKNPESQDVAASSEVSQQGSQFQLDQGQNSGSKPYVSTRTPTTTKRISEGKPQTDKLSSADNSHGTVQKQPGGGSQDSGVISVNGNPLLWQTGLLATLLLNH